MKMLEITESLRRCEVDGKAALFHRWCDVSEIVPPSVMVGGHGGGVVQDTFGIVEYLDGSVARVKPERIVFITEAANNSEEKDNPTSENKPQSSGAQCKETKIKCPHCKEENKNAIVWCDAAEREYFVYCQKCGIETIDVFPTAARAIKAFSDGKNKNIIEKYH